MKSFLELYDLDLKKYTSKKPTFKWDKQGKKYVKTGELDYLSWANCLYLLHTNGAKKVRYGNVKSSENHPLFLLDGKWPFVRVFVAIDDERCELDYPLIEGTSDISIEDLNQSDIHNATQRGFVKCVGVNWGLGLKLWQKEERALDKQRESLYGQRPPQGSTQNKSEPTEKNPELPRDPDTINYATPNQVAVIRKLCNEEEVQAIKNKYGVSELVLLPRTKAVSIIKKLKERGGDGE